MGPPLPMKATAGELPTGDGWVHEVKWDGMRAIVAITDGAVRLFSSQGNDVTVSFPELAGFGAAVGVTDAIIDGEIVALDDRGRPDFGLLQQRMHVSSARAAAERSQAVPVALFVFDLLQLDGNDLLDVAWSDRRRLLDALVEPGAHWQLPATHTDGAALLAAADANQLEGIVSKRTDSRYRPGSRTKEWIKVKIRRRQEFVIGGWAPGSGSRSDTIGAVLVGYHDEPGNAALRYAGRVGSGLGVQEVEVLAAIFADSMVASCPFDPMPPSLDARDAVWVRPLTVVEVAFAEWTGDGRLRHPSYAGRRNDVDPGQVTAAP